MWHDRTIDLAAMFYYPAPSFHSGEENNSAAGRTFNSITLTYALTYPKMQFFCGSRFPFGTAAEL